MILDKAARELVLDRIQLYFKRELDQEIGRFDADFLLDFFSTQIGALHYNQALSDIQTLLRQDTEETLYRIGEMEKPLP